MLYSQKVFGQTVNNKCLASEASTYEDQQNCCEVRNWDDDDDDYYYNIITTF